MGFTKIIVHWTAGGYTPNSVDLKHYHYLIDGNGNVNHGIYKPEDNLNCNDGKYAAHTGGGNTGCYDALTEVLTDTGWKFFENVDISKDKFFTMDKNCNPCYEYATKYFKYKIDDTLINFKSKCCDLMVTENHNMALLSEKTKKIYFKTAMEIENYSSVSIPMNKSINSEDPEFVQIGNKKIKFNLFLMFLGLFISEGYCSKPGNKYNHGSMRYRIIISQNRNSNPDKFKIILNLLNKLPYKYCIYKNNIEINNKDLWSYFVKLGKQESRYIPNEFKNISISALDTLWYWLMLGDGTYGSGNTEHYYTISKKLIDDLQEILATHGYRSNVYVRIPKDRYIEGRLVKKEKQKISYELIKYRRKNTFLSNNFTKRIKYNGFVYCVTVPSHTLLTRRNYNIQWSGNSIGVTMCGMLGFKNKNAVGAYPLKAKQVEACFKLCAELCKKYNIPIENVWTHYEFGKNHPDTTSAGKIDIIYLPPYPDVKTNEVGNLIRRKVRWYYERL